MSDAVFYNTLAWVINGSSHYTTNVASWINTWFLAKDTYMNPNMNYAQVQRGPTTSHIGRKEGVLDLKCMVKIVNSVLVLRAGNAPGWTSAIDSGLVAWTESYIGWLTTNQLALEEAAATKCVTLMSSPCLWAASRMPPHTVCFFVLSPLSCDSVCLQPIGGPFRQQSWDILLWPACGAANPRERC
jgi:hypothetical protein